jgi:hypothetical protein
MPTIGLGAKIEINDGAASAFVVVDDLVNLQVPEAEFGTTDSKLLNQSSDKTIRKLVTMMDPGEFTFQYEFSAVKKARLDALKGVAKSYKITLLSDGATATYVVTAPGILRSNKMDQTEPDVIQMATATVVVTGPVVVS